MSTTPAIPPSAPPPTPPAPAPGALPPAAAKEGRGCMFYGCMIGLVFLVAILLTALGTSWWIHRTINAKALKPVHLNQQEEVALSNKLEYIGEAREMRLRAEEAPTAPTREIDPDFVRKPITLTDREINALIAKHTDLGDRVRVSLYPDEVVAQANIPVDRAAPIIGGRTIRTKVSLHVALKNGNLVLAIRNISVGGFPLPNAWLGNLIGENLVQHDFFSDPVMKAFVEGIEEFRIESGSLYFMPAE
jgi:hypothetical protein